jgi:hypothetical protein
MCETKPCHSTKMTGAYQISKLPGLYHYLLP